MPTINVILQIDEEVATLLEQGKKIPGVLSENAENSLKIFKAFDKSNKKKKEKLVIALEHGWVKESPARIKVFNSLPKKIGTSRMINVLERETKVASQAMIDREVIENV